MCGIVGYCGHKNAAPILLEGLKKLEYRGYDSAGIATLCGGGFCLKRCKGRVDGLVPVSELAGKTGIGHTRWATHGAPTEENAHPHCYGRFAVVHNGIIENEALLKEECLLRGEHFASETDSEVIAHLLEEGFAGDLLGCVRKVCARLRGSYALAILCSAEPDKIIAVREKSPLIVGARRKECFLASDLPAIAGEGVEVYALADGEAACIGAGEVKFYGKTGAEIQKTPVIYDFEGENAEKGGYTHYMEKEIGEVPASIANSLIDFSSESRYSDFCKVLCQTYYIQIIACGTAYHSGIAAKYAMERLARIPVEVCIASEYRYRDPIISPHTLVFAVSQSGETADTLAAAQCARERGALVAAITNVPYSSLTRMADFVLFTHAGREIAVAATKSYAAQLALLFSVALFLSKERLPFSVLSDFVELSRHTLSRCFCIADWAPRMTEAKSVFFLGRGVDYCNALEGSLKLKEISYLPSEGYPAGELKHGTLALVDDRTPIVVLLTQRALAEKTMNAVHEVVSRGAEVFLVTSLPEYVGAEGIRSVCLLPECAEIFSPLLSVIPLQLLAYRVAVLRGYDPDKPRNLAKSVTVE